VSAVSGRAVEFLSQRLLFFKILTYSIVSLHKNSREINIRPGHFDKTRNLWRFVYVHLCADFGAKSIIMHI